MLQHLLAELSSDDVFLDVGANLGFFTIFAAHKCKHVIACEPEMKAFERLTTNVSLNRVQNVELLNIALSDHGGAGFITIPCNDATIQDAHLSDSGQPIELRRGDSMEIVPTVAKIDVEGHEVAVLRGLGEHLRSVRMLLCEIHTESGVDAKEVEAALSQFGPWTFSYWKRHHQMHLLARRDVKRTQPAKP